jgi:two-component system sensor histidine kinase/response regulator
MSSPESSHRPRVTDAEQALAASEQRLAAQSRALTELTARYTDPAAHIDDRLREILEVSARTLDVERLSMWRFGDGRLAIRCIGMFERSPGRHTSGALLYRHEAPAYFQAIERERVVAADDAGTDPRTREFRDGYLVPNGIGAMLDVPLRQHNATIGVLCAEHVGQARNWTVDEQNFSIASANLIVAAVADEERRAALSRLAESEARARQVVDTAHDAFIGIDSSGRIITWNAQAEVTFGWTAAEAIGRPLAETVIPPAWREAHANGLERFHNTGEAPVVNKRLELTAMHRTGREFPIEITISPPVGAENGFFFGAFLRDISDRRERDAQLRAAKESAEAATRAKSEFLASMSHELRTPLNGVLGYTQLLQRDRGLNSSQREALEAISKCGSHLLDLINDVLDLSKIEAGRIDVEATSTDLTQLVTDLNYLVAETARRKGLQLVMTIGPEVPKRVVVDGRHLRQVLLNLIGNATKFTPQGEIRLIISRTDDERLLFEVIDTGVGIEPQALTRIFEAFTQTSTGFAAGGSGLGLNISHHLVATMGGELEVESVPGQGSRFFFSLPLVLGKDTARSGALDVERATPPFDARLAEGVTLTALVVDDSTISRRILASLLESAGVQVITAAGGRESIALAREHRPDVVFMDLRMTDIDGFEATRQLRADPVTSHIPVIAVSASAFGDTRVAATDAGCVDYLPKPVRAESLFAALAGHLGVQFVAHDEPPPAAVAEPAVFDAVRRRAIAARVREAAMVGAVSDLELLAQELATGDTGEVALGQRISRLVTNFEFGGLYELADSLAAGDSSGRTGL